jgi:putative ABC transport system permease protein
MMLRATLKSLLGRKLRLILSALAVVLGVMFVSGSFVLTDTLSRSFDDLFRGIYSTVDVQVGAAGQTGNEMDDSDVPRTIPAAAVAQVRAVAGVANAVGEVSSDGARLIGANGKVVSSFGPPSLGESWTARTRSSSSPGSRGPANDNEIAINADLATKAGVKVGDQVGVLTREPKQLFTIVGIFGFSGGRDTLGGVQMVAFTEHAAQRLMLGESDTYTAINVTAADGVSPAAAAGRDRGQARPSVLREDRRGARRAAAASFASVLDIFNNVLLGFAGVALFVGAFLILNTFSIIVAQRTKELALMRAVGASRRQMIGSVVVEAVAIGLLASVLGLAAGFGVGRLMAYVFSSLGGGGLALAGVTLPGAAVISAFAVGLLVTMAASVLPALRASRIPPIAALQEVATPDRPLTKLSVSGAAVTAAGGTVLGLALAGRFADGAATLWGVLGGALGVFLGIALLTPLLSRPVVSALGRLMGSWVPGKLGRRNAGRNPRRTGITAAALMVGVALVTAVGVVLESATVSFTKTTEETVHAELYIGGDQTSDRPPSFDAGVLTRAAQVPGVAKVLGVWHEGATVDGGRAPLTALNNPAALRDVFGVTAVEGNIDSVSPTQLLVDSQLAAQLGLHVGSTLTLGLTRGDSDDVHRLGRLLRGGRLRRRVHRLRCAAAALRGSPAAGGLPDAGSGRDRSPARCPAVPRAARGLTRGGRRGPGRDDLPADRRRGHDADAWCRSCCRWRSHRRARHHQHAHALVLERHPRAGSAPRGRARPGTHHRDGHGRGRGDLGVRRAARHGRGHRTRRGCRAGVPGRGLHHVLPAVVATGHVCGGWPP